MSDFCRNRIKVGPTFSSFNPFLSLPFIETDKKNSLNNFWNSISTETRFSLKDSKERDLIP